MTPFLLIGLGNPGKSYEGNRHNIGFMAVDAIAEKYGVTKWSKKFQGLLAETTIDRQKTLLLKPQTYMNLSGDSVIEAMQFYKIPPESICVIHDEVDFDFATVKLKKSGGNAGHNGLKSIESHIGNDFLRCRFGVGKGASDLADYVLSDFSKEERKDLAIALPNLATGLFPAIRQMHKMGANNLKIDLLPQMPKPLTSVSANKNKLDSRLRGNDEE